MAFTATLSTWAETPKECIQKHPKALCTFLKTPKYTGNLEGFDIERLAIYPISDKVAIKTTQREMDIVKNVKDAWSDDEMLYFSFTDGSALAINSNAQYVIYVSTKGDRASFLLDEYRQKMYEGMIESYNTDEH